MEPIDELQEIPARSRIEPRHGLVEHQDLGLHASTPANATRRC